MKEVTYQQAKELKRPNPVTLCSCVGDDGKPNIITLGWEMQTSIEPLMFAVSIAFQRYSYELIEQTGEFVVAWPGENMAEAAMLCGTRSGRDIDKFTEAGLEAIPAKIVKPPLIGGCLANFECKVTGKLDTGDHRIYAGECVAIHVDETVSEGRLYVVKSGKMAGVIPSR